MSREFKSPLECLLKSLYQCHLLVGLISAVSLPKDFGSSFEMQLMMCTERKVLWPQVQNSAMGQVCSSSVFVNKPS